MTQSLLESGMDEEELCAFFEQRAKQFREALEQIAFGSVACADGKLVKMTAFRMSQIAKSALRAKASHDHRD